MTADETSAGPGVPEPAEQTATGLIVVGVDDSPEARAAAAYAAQAGVGTSGATVLLAHAYRAPTGFLDVAGQGMVGELEAAARKLVDGLAAELRSSYATPIETVIDPGKPVPFLVRLAVGASRVVLGQDTATLFDRMTFGSVAGRLAATAPCPVVIVPATWQPSVLGDHPVIALSGDHPAGLTLSTAIEEAKHLGTGVLVVHVVGKAASSAEVEEHEQALAALVATAGQAVAVETRIMRGHPDDQLVQVSVDAAAAVVGRSHRQSMAAWMRSVAHAVAKRTHCPLIIVPAD